ncbi:UNC5C-like protein isoform X2 [Mytilus galloprovincialis]|uniref:UNC5C-like protein isoform X1 n=1 Tax=Mytilus galloprovincialis TaxID=29158 RepID=UPI003F7B61A1
MATGDAGLIIAVLVLLLVIGLGLFGAFLCWKLREQHSSINNLQDQLEKLKEYDNHRIINLEKQIKYLKANIQADKGESSEIVDETVTFRQKKISNDDIHVDVDDILPNNPQHQDRLIKPSMVIKIGKDITNAHGHVQLDSQVVAIAQNNYKHKTKSKNLIGIDEMDFVLKEGDKFFMSETTRRQTIYNGRPTSVLINESSFHEEKGKSEKGIFVHKTLGKSGGVLQVLGIQLVIPSDALTEDTQLTVGVTWDASIYPSLTKQSSLLSPVVVCQPAVKFLKPVILSFPHCAVHEKENWILKVLNRENDLHCKNDEWRDLDEENAGDIDINNNKVVLKLRHFTLYAVVGESLEGKTAAKAVKLLAFTSPLQRDKMFTVRIYCINNYDEIKDIKKEAMKLNEKQADVLQPLFIRDNDEDVTVSLMNVSKGWKTDGEKSQNIDFECIWHCLSPSCKFLFHPETTVNKIVCDFNYNQHSSTKVRSLKVAQEQIQFLPLALKENVGPEYTLLQKMILKLDPKSDNDYRILAEKIGYTYEQIKWLETQDSPTEILLDKWISGGKLVSDLKGHLSDIGRLDVLSEIEEYESSIA